MKRFALLLAAMMILIPAAGCQDTGGAGSGATPSPPAETTTPATTGKAPKKVSEATAKAAANTANPNGPKNDH
jgi:hypothetical protein